MDLCQELISLASHSFSMLSFRRVSFGFYSTRLRRIPRCLTQFSASGHQSPGLWRHPEDESHRFNDIDHWIELAKLLEDAKFHGIFIADVLGEQLYLELFLAGLEG